MFEAMVIFVALGILVVEVIEVRRKCDQIPAGHRC